MWWDKEKQDVLSFFFFADFNSQPIATKLFTDSCWRPLQKPRSYSPAPRLSACAGFTPKVTSATVATGCHLFSINACVGGWQQRWAAQCEWPKWQVVGRFPQWKRAEIMKTGEENGRKGNTCSLRYFRAVWSRPFLYRDTKTNNSAWKSVSEIVGISGKL